MSTKSAVPDEKGGEVEHVASTPAPLIDAEGDEWAGVDDGDLSPNSMRSIPFLALDRRSNGGFKDAETGEILHELDFVWLARSLSRAWWPTAFGAKGDPIPDCYSLNGLKPSSRGRAVQSPSCATCSKTAWESDDPAYRRCSTTVDMMVFLADPMGGFGRLARMRMSGLAFSPAQSYWDSFSVRMPRRPAMSCLSHITLELTETPNGMFYVPSFRRVRSFTIDEARPLIEERDRRIAEWQDAVAADVATGATADEPTPSAPAAGGTGPGTYVTDDGDVF